MNRDGLRRGMGWEGMDKDSPNHTASVGKQPLEQAGRGIGRTGLSLGAERFGPSSDVGLGRGRGGLELIKEFAFVAQG